MLVITSLQGQTEALPDVKSVEINEQVNGEFSLSFTCFFTERNQHAYPLVQEESVVELNDHEYRIKQMTEVQNQKEVHAQHVYFDLVDHPQEGTFGGTHTVDEFFNYALAGTGWTFENVDVTESAFIPNFGEGNVVALINQICTAFNCEIKIEPNKHIKIYKKIGEDTDNQFRYRHNIKTLKKSVDTTKLATAIKGYGADGLVVEYHSPNESIYGTRYAEPITDDNYTEAESLREKLKQQLVDVPEVSIDIELSQLGFDVELGDRIWLIYEPVNIEFQTRIMQMKSYPFTHKSPVVTLSNVKQTVTDILTQQKIEIDQNKKETHSKIEQTNEKITLEVERIDESISSIQMDADSIRLSVQNLETEVQSDIEIVNNRITLEVNQLNKSIASIQIQSNNIQLSVQSLDDRMGNAESQLSIQSNQISSKVSQTDFNGNTIASLINQTATNVTISANKIDLNGITRVSDALWLGSSTSQTRKALNFKSSASIYTPDYSDNLVIDSMGEIFLRSGYSDGVRVGTPSYSVPIVTSYQSYQPITLEVTGSGGLVVRVNGKTATFSPTSWTG